MTYKTITLAMIEDREALHRHLKARKETLQALDRYARSLRERHLALMEEAAASEPHRSTEQRSSEAMEIAVSELEAELDQVAAELSK